MGCGASQEEVVEAPAEEAPPPEVDPLDALLAQIRSQRTILTENIKKLEESNAHVRYLWSTVIKFRLTMEELDERRAEEAEMDAVLQHHIASQDADDIREATKGMGTDEEKLAKVLVTRLQEMIMQTDYLYKTRYRDSLEVVMNKEGKSMLGFLTGALSDFGRFCSYRVMPQPRRDALLLRKCMAGMGTDDKALVEILTTRTNAELHAAAEAYAAEFDGESLVGRIKDETGGMFSKNYGEWVDALCEFDRDESGEVPDNVEDLATQLYEAGAAKFMGCDEEVFKNILCKANDATCAAIAAAYQETQGRSLFEDVGKKMSGDLEFSVLARITPRLDFLAGRIYKACKGLGTDEQGIVRVLGCLSNREVHLLRDRYNALQVESDAPYNDFRALLEAELSGDFLAAIQTMLDEPSPKGHWKASAMYPAEAAAAGGEFQAAVEGSYNDFEAIHHGKSELDGPLLVIGQEDFIINSEVHTEYPPSGPLPEIELDRAYLFETEPGSVEEAEPLLEALKTTNASLEEQHQFNEESIAHFRGKYAESAFKLRELDTLTKQLKDDNAAMLEFCAERDADNVHEAAAGWGTDEDKLIKVLCALSKRQLARVDEIYREKYEKSLKDEIDGELGEWFSSSADFKYFMMVMLTAAAEMDAELLDDAMRGLGTDESLLSEIICTRTNKELRAAKAAFLEKNGKTVENWVADDTSGTYQKFLIRCLRADRKEGFDDKKVAARQVTQLLDAGLNGDGSEEGKDVDKIFSILAVASSEHLQLLKAAYEESQGNPLTEAIKADLGGDVEEAVVARMTPKFTYFAQVLNKAWKGFGTDEKATSRIFGRCTKSELKVVGEEYTRQTGVGFKHAIESETGGLYKKALLTYLFDGWGQTDEEAAAESE